MRNGIQYSLWLTLTLTTDTDTYFYVRQTIKEGCDGIIKETTS